VDTSHKPAPLPARVGGGEVPDEDRLYREAHHAHFVERNPARALAAWDAYLRAQKSGRFATEATYNRALTLLRLGRTAEARKALEPFAQGRFGTYRKEEARKLLDALLQRERAFHLVANAQVLHNVGMRFSWLSLVLSRE
jgi:hypothetical protein